VSLIQIKGELNRMSVNREKTFVPGSSVIRAMLKRLAKEEVQLLRDNISGHVEAGKPPRVMAAKV
jgi:hypothetical protein